MKGEKLARRLNRNALLVLLCAVSCSTSCKRPSRDAPAQIAAANNPEPNQGDPPGNLLPSRCELPLGSMAGLAASSQASGFPSASCVSRALSLTRRLSLPEKIGQLAQPNVRNIQPSDVSKYMIGSVLSGGGSGPSRNTPGDWARMIDELKQEARKTPHGIPLLYGLDAVHGHNNVYGATLFPHNIALGATRDPALVERIGRASALEIAATSVDWTFSPVIATARDERWGRTYEAFGETLELAEQLGPALIRGLQGPDLNSSRTSVLACAKHFLGDGNTQGGIDRGNAVLSPQAIASDVLPAYQAAVQAGVGSIMVSFSSVQGVRMHCNGPLLNDSLKERLGFGGFLVSDWGAVELLPGNYADQLSSAFNAGLDMVMHPHSLPEFVETMQSLAGGRIPMQRIDDAVARILGVKCEMGLLPSSDNSPPARAQPIPLSVVGQRSHRDLAREAVRKSLVLLKNDRALLPLSNQHKRWHIAGTHADDIGLQSGGWSISWRGKSGEITKGTTFLQAFRKASLDVAVSHSRDGSGAQGADAAVVFLGEQPYAEWHGDREDLTISEDQLAIVRRARQQQVPVVVVLVTGRPLILGELMELADALVVAWLPGTEGAGVVDVLTGAYDFSGRLPHSWPRSMADVPINHGDNPYSPLFPYGFGLRYSN